MYVTHMGMLYSISRLQYQRYLKARAANLDPLLDHFGARAKGIIENVTDLSVDEAKDRLENFQLKKTNYNRSEP